MKSDKKPRIAVLGTFDTKGEELLYVAEAITSLGSEVLTIDVGTGCEHLYPVDVNRNDVAAAVQLELEPLLASRDRGACVSAMSEAAPELLSKLVEKNEIQAVISLGGGGGTAIATAAMRALPLGFPKLMVSTMVSGNCQPYVDTSDIVMFPGIVDVAGLNRISKMIFSNAAKAICGMVMNQDARETENKPVIVASMFGNTTECVNEARQKCEAQGYEVLTFAATGVGGRTMEKIIASGMVAGVLDITATEWADEVVGGVLNAGPNRHEAAGRAGVPAVVVPGCLDMVNFGEKKSIPEKFKGRNFVVHNPQVTLMRTTAEECQTIGKILAEKINTGDSPCTVLLPLKGLSKLSVQGQPFYDASADQALFEALKSGLKEKVKVIELDTDINSPVFAHACADELLRLLRLER